MESRTLVSVTLVVTAAGCTDTGASDHSGMVLDTAAESRFAALAEGRASPRAMRFAVIGDYGVDEPQEGEVAALVEGWSPDLVLTVGDNNYESGSADTIDDNIGKYYQRYIGNYQGVWGTGSTTNRFWPALGNHDWDTPGAEPYLDYFTLPGNERYYEFERGPVHFFALDSDASEPDGATTTSAQAAWLERALASSTARWKVVYFHHPPYSSWPGDTTARMQWPFESWGADLVLSGHSHGYERLSVGGLTYVVNGLGGREREPPGSAVAGSQVRFDDDWGAMRVDATETELRMRFVTRAGVVVDGLSLLKEGPSTTTRFQDGAAPTAGYGGTTDAAVAEAAPTRNFGAAGSCSVDGDAGGGAAVECLLRWDVSAIPPGSSIREATLVLDVTNPSSGDGHALYELGRRWVESEVTWNRAAVGARWQVPGARGPRDHGDRVATIRATATGPTEFPLGPAGAALVQRWIEDPSGNFGVALAGSTSDALEFASSEAVSVASRPELVVTWSP